jgi:NAD(P)-dependent dehydrogenase (short-subunit alcohol dehydrogenase family)
VSAPSARDHGARNAARFDFGGASVLVTGGTSGIGLGVARAFADAGASVTVTGTRSDAADYDGDLSAFAYRPLRLDHDASVDALVAGLDRLDVLVNNAGATFPGGLDEWDPAGFSAALATNLAGTMRLSVACGPLLATSALDGGASVVMTTSMAAFRAVPLVPGYASAKAGLVALTRNLALRWVGERIRVNAVAPGLIDTPMTRPMAEVPELLDAELSRVPMGRMGRPEDVAAAVLYLCSSSAAYVTGTVLAVDGGWLAG